MYRNTDSWGLGCLIWEIFNGFLTDIQKLKTQGKITKKAYPLYGHLINNNYRSRCSIQDFIKKGSENNGYFKNVFIETMIFLEEIQVFNSIHLKFFDLRTKFFSIRLRTQLRKIASFQISTID